VWLPSGALVKMATGSEFGDAIAPNKAKEQIKAEEMDGLPRPSQAIMR
jgi:hypothetical protein